jgi:SAM-dependent methyltransferase
MRGGFPRSELQARYNVAQMSEDVWHRHSAAQTIAFIKSQLPAPGPEWRSLLNAGAGVYEIGAAGYSETFLDLFMAPIQRREHAVCGSVEQMPFEDATFDVAVCVGEVLSYCDPARAIAEFARVLRLGGILMFDYSSSRSARHWLKPTHGRSADIFIDEYNGTPERVWVYGPDYVSSLLRQNSFEVRVEQATHCWSAILRWAGTPLSAAVFMEKLVGRYVPSNRFCDLITVAAVKC